MEDKLKNVSLREVLHVVFKRKRLILTVFLLIAIGVFLGVLVTPRDYEASATLFLKRERSDIVVSPTQGSLVAASMKAQIDQDLRSEAELVHRRSLLAYVVRTLGPENVIQGVAPSSGGGEGPKKSAFGVAIQRVSRGLAKTKDTLLLTTAWMNTKESMSPEDVAIMMLDQKLKVTAVDQSDVIKVVFTGSDRRFSNAVLDLLTRRYLEEYSRVRTSPGTVEFFQAEMDKFARELREAEDREHDFAKNAIQGITPLGRQREIWLQTAVDKEGALETSKAEVAGLQEKTRHLRARLEGLPETVPTEEEWRENPARDVIRTKLLEMDVQKNHLLQLYTDADRRVQDIDREIDTLKQRFLDETPWQRVRQTVAENRLRQPLMVDLVDSEGQLLRATVRMRSLEAESRAVNAKLAQIDTQLYERGRLDRDVHLKEDNYLLYAKKYQEARIQSAMDTNRIVNVTLAEPVQVAPKPGNAAVLSVLGAAVGLVSGIGLAFVRESLDSALDSDDRVRRAVGVPVVASIPDTRA